MEVPKKFWAEESHEKSHKDIKEALEKKAGIKKPTRKKAMAIKKKVVKKTKKVSRRVEQGQSKVAKVEREFKEKKLHSGSKKGPLVTNPRQATAIALSESRKAGAKIPKKKK